MTAHQIINMEMDSLLLSIQLLVGDTGIVGIEDKSVCFQITLEFLIP